MKSHAAMNRIYRLVWNALTNAWVAVAETAKGRGKGSSRKLIAAALSLSGVVAFAGPQGGALTAGAGHIAQAGSTTTITQTSQSLSLNWNSFNVAKQETVNFVQPSASAVAVNRIFDTNASRILGNININANANANANGQVYLINPNGILFGMGAGNAVTLNFNGNSLVKMQIDQSVLNSQSDNGGLIQADGGMVLMSAGANDELLASVVNNTGVIEARTAENRDGTIILLGGMTADRQSGAPASAGVSQHAVFFFLQAVGQYQSGFIAKDECGRAAHGARL